MTDMDMPLPEPASGVMAARWASGDSPSLHKQGTALIHGVNTYTADQLHARDAQWRAIVAAEVARERERFQTWISEGEELMKLKENASAMFSLGRWWGERPWSK